MSVRAYMDATSLVFTHKYFEQIYLATQGTTQNCTKMLRMLLLLYRLHIIASDQIKEDRNKKKSFFF